RILLEHVGELLALGFAPADRLNRRFFHGLFSAFNRQFIRVSGGWRWTWAALPGDQLIGGKEKSRSAPAKFASPTTTFFLPEVNALSYQGRIRSSLTGSVHILGALPLQAR